MDRIAKALAEHDEVYADVARVLFGGGADELISKLSAEEKHRQKRQAQVGLASNIVGLAAGVQGTYAAGRAYKDLRAVPSGTVHKPKPFTITRKTKAAAGAALGLQALNVGGDVVANRVLAREATKKAPKKKKDVHVKKGLIAKALPDQADLHAHGSPSKVALKAAKKISQQPKIQAGKERLVLKMKNDGRNILKADEMDIEWTGEISKVDDDKRQVFGFASVTKVDGEDVVDKQGDHISIEEVEKAAYDYVHKSRKGGNMHRRDGSEPLHVSDMIESVVFTDEKIAKMGLPDDFPRAWWVGYQINDDETWREVKDGKKTAFSIHGSGSRVSKVLS